MRISIIVPAFNEERLIGGTLASVNEARGAFAERGWESELIVCDNNSTDKTAEIAKANGATVVFEPVNQIGRARNCGAAAASGEWLVFVDADSQPSKALFADAADAVASGRILAGGSTVRLDAEHRVGKRVVRLWNWVSRSFSLLAGSFIFCETAVFREAGGFSQELYAAEELDLSIKLKRLARRQRRRVVVLKDHPLTTSARKMHLYSTGEHLRFILKAALNRKALTRRESCPIWYDGRR